MYGMEYTQIIHPSSSIKKKKGLKMKLDRRMNGLSHKNLHFKKQIRDYTLPDEIKSDRLLDTPSKNWARVSGRILLPVQSQAMGITIAQPPVEPMRLAHASAKTG